MSVEAIISQSITCASVREHVANPFAVLSDTSDILSESSFVIQAYISLGAHAKRLFLEKWEMVHPE